MTLSVKPTMTPPAQSPIIAFHPAAKPANCDPFLPEIALPAHQPTLKLLNRVVRLSPETESRLPELAATTRRAPEEIVEDAMTGYLVEFARVRDKLDRRYDEMKTGQIHPIDGEEVFRQLRQKS
jgi:predicted transcriptional regulator